MDMDWNVEVVDQLEAHWERVIHHGAEVCLLRDLYLWKDSRDGL